jgi:DNA-binding CsgD family transcriptional regulator
VRTISKGKRGALELSGFRACAAISRIGWRSSAAAQALDRLSLGVVVSDESGQVAGMNRSAQSMVRLEEGLAIRDGRLCARRSFETAKLLALISATAAASGSSAAARHVLIARGGRRSGYILTITPLGPGPRPGARQQVLIVIVDPERHSPSGSELSELFGFSPAEARLAVALMTGRTPTETAAELGVRVSTVRTQLRSILKKAGARGQSDLARIVASAGMGSVSLAAGWVDVALEALQIPLATTGLCV